MLKILLAADAPIDYDTIEVGKAVFLRGVSNGIPDDAWDVIRKNKVMLKGPITTPQGGGYKSVNVTIRTSLNLFANVRQSRAYAPYVTSAHPHMDLVIIRENEEDLYAGIEHQQTSEVTQSLKLITRPGSERIIRYAFEYARAHGREKVTCMSKDNIMKVTDGLFHKIFDEVATEYPEIETEHMIIDIGAAKIAAQPERFEVIVTLNLYGDILSDIAAEIAGSVGLAGSANVGENLAMFEAVHGSAPDIAGKDMANPSGLLTAAVQMLVHLGEADIAERINNAWLYTLEDGVHTGDVYREGRSRRLVGTQAFAEAIIANLGRKPRRLTPVRYKRGGIKVTLKPAVKLQKKLVGSDVFLDWDQDGRKPNALGDALARLDTPGLKLKMMTNRGVKVYPDGMPETFCTDHWRARFVGVGCTHTEILALLTRIDAAGFDVIKTENLYLLDGTPGFSLGAGE